MVFFTLVLTKLHAGCAVFWFCCALHSCSVSVTVRMGFMVVVKGSAI